MTAMFVSYNIKSYHSAGRLRDELAISTNLVENRLCAYVLLHHRSRSAFQTMDPVQHSSVNLISVSPLVADPHEAAHVTVGLSSIPEAGQG